MRIGFAFKNTLASFLVEIVAAISGIILPRFFISVYGSSVNGLVSSISQFITYMGLVEAGVSAAATVELYKPLAQEDHNKINEIVSAAKAFYLKSGVIFVILDVLLILGYPFVVQNEIADARFVRMMIAVLSLNGIIDYFLLGKYRVLLTADQKTYIIAIAQSVGTVVTLILSIILIKINCSPVLVKGVVSVVYLIRTLYVIFYVKRNYDFIDFNQKYYSDDVFSQRKSALFHHVIGMICNNTDIVLLTIMLPHNALIEVSVYTAYNMVAANLTALFNSISRGLGASFGNIIAGDDRETLEKSFNFFELLYFIFLFIVYTCMGILLYSFISLYSSNFSDQNVYLRWSLVGLFTVSGLVQNIRVPGSTIQIAAGHFKQTQGAALLEVFLNFGISIALVRTLGIVGVLLGTIVAYLYRSTYVIIYNANVFLKGTLNRTLARIVRNSSLFIVLIWVGVEIIYPIINTWYLWIMFALIVLLVSSVSFLALNYIFEPRNVRNCLISIKSYLRKK